MNAKKPIETPKIWLRYAEGDLSVVEREMKSDIPVYHTVCFLCQSAAEKFLKAYLISEGWKLQRTHDLVELLGYCTDYDENWEELLTEGAILNEYIVSGRYPGDIAAEGFDDLLAKEALDAVQQIQARVRKVFQQNHPTKKREN